MQDFRRNYATFHSWYDFILASSNQGFKGKLLRKQGAGQQKRREENRDFHAIQDQHDVDFDEHFFI